MNDASPGGLILDPGGVCAAPDPVISSSEIALVRARFESSLASVPRRSRFVPRSFRLSDLNNFIALPINPADRRPVLVGDLPRRKNQRASSGQSLESSIGCIARALDPIPNASRPFASRMRPEPPIQPSSSTSRPSRRVPSIAPRTHPTSSSPSSLESLSSLARVDRRPRALILSRMSRMCRRRNQMNARVDTRAPLRAMRRRDVSRRRRARIASRRLAFTSDDSIDALRCEEMSRHHTLRATRWLFPSRRGRSASRDAHDDFGAKNDVIEGWFFAEEDVVVASFASFASRRLFCAPDDFVDVLDARA